MLFINLIPGHAWYLHDTGMVKNLLIVMVMALGLASCRGDVQDPEFRRIENFGVKSVGLQHATLGFQITYFNPNNFGVTVKEAEADVYIDTLLIGRLVQDQPTEVRGNSEFSIPMTGAVTREVIRKLNLPQMAMGE